MPEAPVPGQTVGQSNPAQPAGYNPPATPAPQDHPPPTYAPIDSSGGWMPNGPIPAVVYAPVQPTVTPPAGATGYTAPGFQYAPPDQGQGVIIGPGQQAPPNTQPGLSGGGGVYGGGAAVPTVPPAGPGQWTTGNQWPAGTQPVIAGPVGAPGTGVDYAGNNPTVAMPAPSGPDLWLQTAAATPVQAPPNNVPGYGHMPNSNPPQIPMPASVPQPYLSLRPICIQLGGLTADTLLIGGAGRIVYAMIREATGATSATFSFTDGTPAVGQVVIPFSLTAGQSTRDIYMPHGIPFIGDLWLDLDAGSLVGAVYVVPEDLFILSERLAERALRGAELGYVVSDN